MARLRNRIVKADFYTDPDLLRWPRDKRETYRGLWAIAEDSGCLEDDPFGWKLLIWPSPLDADITEEVLAGWRDEMVAAGKLVPYEAEGKHCLWIRTFHQHEKPRNPQRPDLPLPPWVRWVGNPSDPRKGHYEVDATLVQASYNGVTTVPAPPRPIYTFGCASDAAQPVETVETVENLQGLKPLAADADNTITASDPPPDRRTEGQRLVAFYVDERAKRGRSKPTRTQIGILARIVGEKLQGGADPELLRRSLRCLVERGKPPTALPAFLDELEAACRRQPGPGPKPPPEMTPEEKAASIEAAREARRRIEELAAGIGRPMP